MARRATPPGAGRRDAARRALCRGLAIVGAISALALSGCGEPAPDPTATRSDSQAEQLRERLRTVQAAN